VLRSLKEETLPAAQGEVSPPAHLCCCKRGSWVPQLPEAGRARDNPSMALGSGTESCKEQLAKDGTSTKASLNTPNLTNCWTGVQAEAGWVGLGAPF